MDKKLFYFSHKARNLLLTIMILEYPTNPKQESNTLQAKALLKMVKGGSPIPQANFVEKFGTSVVKDITIKLMAN